MMEIDKLRADLTRMFDGAEPVATCEACLAPLLDGDDYVTDNDGTCGCWYAMTDIEPKLPRQCYGYRVGKPDASAPTPNDQLVRSQRQSGETGE